MTKQYYGLKDFADRANERGINTSTEALSVYKDRGVLPKPAVLIGRRAGWSMEQIDKWIDERLEYKK
jgi:hypothetical protein